ncbi:MAG: hypothetical protein AAB116_13420 [Candidatus Poribacteria bacterium]
MVQTGELNRYGHHQFLMITKQAVSCLIGLIACLLLPACSGKVSLSESAPSTKHETLEICTRDIVLIKTIAPNNWIVGATGKAVSPYGYGTDGNVGFYVNLQGTQNIRMEHTPNYSYSESFTLYFMPKNYNGPPGSGPFNVFPLGHNEKYSLYAHQITDTCPTWPSWHTDISKALRLQK